MITLWPAALAPLAKAYRRSGVRWADTMRASWPTPSADNIAAAWRSVAQSDWLPMMIATGFAPIPASEHAFGSAKEAAHYRCRPAACKAAPAAPNQEG